MIKFMQDIYDGMKTFMVGMKVTGGYWKDSNMHEKETVTTIDYDGSMTMARDVKVADRFRGHLHNDIERCIVCKACATACPIDCFWIDGEKTESSKQRPSRFDIDLLKCMYCGLCVFACPTGCLTMTKEWWGATFNTADGTNLHGLLRRFGVGYYSPEQKQVVEKKRLEAAELKKKPLPPPPPQKPPPRLRQRKRPMLPLPPEQLRPPRRNLLRPPRLLSPQRLPKPPDAPPAV